MAGLNLAKLVNLANHLLSDDVSREFRVASIEAEVLHYEEYSVVRYIAKVASQYIDFVTGDMLKEVGIDPSDATLDDIATLVGITIVSGELAIDDVKMGIKVDTCLKAGDVEIYLAVTISGAVVVDKNANEVRIARAIAPQLNKALKIASGILSALRK